MRLAVYTCITDNYDHLQRPTVVPAGVDYFCFSDNPRIVMEPWIYRDIGMQHLAPAQRNRYVKMHPHKYLSEYEASVYIDGNIEVLSDLRPLVVEALGDANIAMYQHPERCCPYDEALACSLIGLEWVQKINAQMARYRQQGFPAKSGLNEAGIIIRRHNEDDVRRAMELWWQEYSLGAARDQLSLNYVLWKTGLAVNNLGKNDARYENRYFFYRSREVRHKSEIFLRKIVNRLILHLMCRGGCRL